MNENGNLTPSRLTASQRAMLAADSVTRKEHGIAGAAAAYGASPSTVERALAIKKRSIDVASDVRRGKTTIAKGLQRVGYRRSRSVGKNVAVGDQWDSVIPLALSYARHWAGRSYVKLNPKEAERRLRELRELQTALGEIASELTERSQSARLRLGDK